VSKNKQPVAPPPVDTENTDLARRKFFKKLGLVGATGITAAVGAGKALSKTAWGGATFEDALGDFFQDHYVRMTDDEMRETLARIERKALRKFGVGITCEDTRPIPGTYFGFALNISKCRGYRDCVTACVKENNLGRDSQVQYIRVLELDEGDSNLQHADHYYEHETVLVERKL